jgi:hypothetical protein
MKRNWRRQGAMRSLTKNHRFYLAAGTLGSLLWVAYWIRYFARHCELGSSLACVEPNVLWTVYYSLPAVLVEVLGVPALLFAAWFAIARASRSERESGSRRDRERDRLRG